MFNQRVKLIVASILFLGGIPTLVQAEQDAVLEEIVVTATKRGSQALQDIPTSITALGEDTLANMGAVSIDDVTRTIAALDVVDVGPGQKQYLIRGINAEGESTVGVLIDNIPLIGGGDSSRRAGTNMPDFDLFDMERVEVLRGPQGTLYGQNSVAGVLRYVTNKPDFSGTEARVQAGGSTFSSGDSSWDLKAMVNTVLSEDVALRGVLSYRDNGGYIDNLPLGTEDINSFERLNARLTLAWNVADNSKLTLQYIHQTIDQDGRNSHQPFDWSESVGPPFMYAADGSFIGSTFILPAAGELKNNTPINEPYKEDSNTFALTFESSLDWGDLTVALSQMERDQEVALDSSTPWLLHNRFQSTGQCLFVTGNCAFGPPFGSRDGKPTVPPIPPFVLFASPATIISPTGLVYLEQEQSQDTFNFEARVATDFDGPLNAVFGLFYNKRNTDLDFSRVWPGDPVTGNPIRDPNFLMLDRFSEITTTQRAIFGELYYQITENVELTAGVRAFDTEQDLDQTLIVPFLANPAIGGPPGRSQFGEDVSDEIFKLGIAWQATDDVLLYASSTEGFRNGGVNNQVVPVIPPLYSPDKTKNLEIGAKTSWLDGRLKANLAVYQIDWEDLQIGVNFTDQFGGLVNAGGDIAEIDGFEIEILFAVTDQLVLGINYADIDARLTANTADAIPTDLLDAVEAPRGTDGDSLLGSPEHSGSMFGQLDFTMNGMEAYIRADIQFQSQVKNNNYHPARNQPSRSYELINVNFGIRQDEHWSYTFYVRNVMDEIADLAIFNNFQQNNRTTPAAPRSFGFTVNYDM